MNGASPFFSKSIAIDSKGCMQAVIATVQAMSRPRHQHSVGCFLKKRSNPEHTSVRIYPHMGLI